MSYKILLEESVNAYCVKHINKHLDKLVEHKNVKLFLEEVQEVELDEIGLGFQPANDIVNRIFDFLGNRSKDIEAYLIKKGIKPEPAKELLQNIKDISKDMGLGLHKDEVIKKPDNKVINNKPKNNNFT